MTNIPQPLRICFVVPGAYSLFDDSVSSRYGGAEVRAWLFANEIAKRPDFDVHFVVYDFGQPSPQKFGNITVHANPAMSRHWSPRIETIRSKIQRVIQTKVPYINWQNLYLKFPFHVLEFGFKRAVYIIRKLIKKSQLTHNSDTITILNEEYSGWTTSIYENIRADVYAVFGLANHSAEVVAYTKKCQAGKSIFFVAHDSNFDDVYDSENYENDWIGYSARFGYYTLTNADYIVAQTEYQAQLAKVNFQRDSTVIRNPIVLELTNFVPYEQRETVLWVGRDHHMKRPEMYVRLAKAFPDTKFVMVMNRSGVEKQFDNIVRNIPHNIEFYEYVPYHEIDSLFANAKVFISTSSSEGLPNTFLNAGKYSVPILSLTVDPDGMVTKGGMGLCANGSFEKLSTDLQWLLNNPDEAIKLSRQSRKYVERHHDLVKQTDKLVAVIKTLHQVT